MCVCWYAITRVVVPGACHYSLSQELQARNAANKAAAEARRLGAILAAF
jgi:outer membrane PBP1 activator LpoA protein